MQWGLRQQTGMKNACDIETANEKAWIIVSLSGCDPVHELLTGLKPETLPRLKIPLIRYGHLSFVIGFGDT